MRRWPPSAARRRRWGFTLLELILVLTLIAIILTIVTASLRGFWADRKLDDTAMAFMTVAKQARVRAVDAAAPMRLVLDFDEQVYRVTDPAAVDAGGNVDADADEGGAVAAEWGRWFEVPAAVTMRWSADPSVSGRRVIDLAPDGRVEAFGVVFVSVGETGGARLVTCLGAGGTFGIQPFTGGDDAWTRVSQLEQ